MTLCKDCEHARVKVPIHKRLQTFVWREGKAFCRQGMWQDDTGKESRPNWWTVNSRTFKGNNRHCPDYQSMDE